MEREKEKQELDRIHAEVQRVLETTVYPQVKMMLWPAYCGALIVSANSYTHAIEINMLCSKPTQWIRVTADEHGTFLGLVEKPGDKYHSTRWVWIKDYVNDYIDIAPPVHAWRVVKALRDAFGKHLEGLLKK
jgi:hypothetical protein